MSAIEIFVIFLGLVVGYGLVNRFMDGRARKAGPQAERKADTGSPAADRADAPWYTVLKVSPSASVDEIHEAYRAQIRQYHPDKVASLGEELRALAEEKSKAINAAYQEALASKGA